MSKRRIFGGKDHIGIKPLGGGLTKEYLDAIIEHAGLQDINSVEKAFELGKKDATKDVSEMQDPVRGQNPEV